MPAMTESSSARVGANIRAELARRGISQARLADAIGMRQTSVSKRLRGVVPLDVDELDAIANYLEVPVKQLLDREVVA